MKYSNWAPGLFYINFFKITLVYMNLVPWVRFGSRKCLADFQGGLESDIEWISKERVGEVSLCGDGQIDMAKKGPLVVFHD